MTRPPIRALVTHLRAVYRAGDALDCSYRIDCESGHVLQSIETSVLWETDGKGDEDIGVHFFEKRKALAAAASQPFEFRLATTLPPSPLTYDGWLVKISWYIRIRVFLSNGHQQTFNFPFKLHSAAGEAKLVTAPPAGDES